MHHRRTILVAIHLVLIVASSYLAFWLRFDGGIPHDARPRAGTKPVLVFGAGDPGEMVVRDDMRRNAFHGHEPVGFVDDNRQNVGQRIHEDLLARPPIGLVHRRAFRECAGKQRQRCPPGFSSRSGPAGPSR